MSKSAASCGTFPTETIGYLLVRRLDVGCNAYRTRMRAFPANVTFAASEVNMAAVKMTKFGWPEGKQ